MTDEMNAITSNKTNEERLLKEHRSDLEHIEKRYKEHKESAIKYLVEALLEVDTTVPDVVIGRFSQKLLGNRMKKIK